MLRALSILLVAALPAYAESSIRLAVPDARGVNVSPETLAFYAEHLAQSLRAPGVSVVTSREISTLLGLERQRQLIGCSQDASACAAELASALGVDAVVVADLGRFEGTWQLNVKALAAADASVLAARSLRVQSEVEVLDALSALGHALARAVLEAKGRPVPAELLRATASPPSARTLAWIPLGAGVAAAATGAVLLSLASDDYKALTTQGGTPLDEPAALTRRQAGQAKQTAGAVCLAAGLTAAVAAGAMFIFGREAPVVAIAPTPGGASLVVSGVWP